ncbi:LAFE_0E01266g1_1 [Lachancea fermentati]|uniref:Sorting nexin MVP1 n=1 Tax=Lachancea fermentati TaxID=4955 RepID=A0A1G4MCD1_LACFM|nr:LAFE_0E01266g1_1 [Lachancea fermentati]
MNFLDEPDPWRSHSSADDSKGGDIWANSDAGNLGASSVLQADALVSRMADTSLNDSRGGIASSHLTATNLFSDPDDNTLQGSAWSASLDTGNVATLAGTQDDAVFSSQVETSTDDHTDTLNAQEDLSRWIENVRKTYNPLSMNIVQIEEIPEREGILFKHTNYLVKHLVDLPDTDPSTDRSVVRRYSDFLWLQEVLLKKYPFRLIPDLPPKKIGSQNTDPIFLTKRRNGLTRFINLIMKHPVLRKDDLVLTFLTVPTDLLGWRKQANYDTTDEFTDRKITPSFMKMWQKELSDLWNQADAAIDSALESWVKITVLVERYEARLKYVAQDRALLSTILNEFNESSKHIYSPDQSTIHDISSHVQMISDHLAKCNDLVSRENDEMGSTLSPKFKTFIDILLSLKGLFERYKIMAGNNVPQLQRRIELSMEKLEQMKGKPDLKGAEYDRVKQAIARDRRSIAEQMNRSWLIRECILEEFTIFQETQFLITNIFQDWSQLNMKYCELSSNEWERLFDNVRAMPLSRD